MNEAQPQRPRMESLGEKISDNEPYRLFMTDPRYAAIVNMLASEMIEGWFDSTQLSEAVRLATKRHGEYVAVHGQRNRRAEFERLSNLTVPSGGMSISIAGWPPPTIYREGMKRWT